MLVEEKIKKDQKGRPKKLKNKKFNYIRNRVQRESVSDQWEGVGKKKMKKVPDDKEGVFRGTKKTP